MPTSVVEVLNYGLGKNFSQPETYKADMASALKQSQLDEVMPGSYLDVDLEFVRSPDFVQDNGSSQKWRTVTTPVSVPERLTRKAPLLVRINRLLLAVLVGMCGLSILGYGLDVAVSSDVTRLGEQSRRLNEQNSELSAELLKAISFQGIQETALGQVGLRVPEQVLIAKEVVPVKAKPFKPCQHHLPLMPGY